MAQRINEQQVESLFKLMQETFSGDAEAISTFETAVAEMVKTTGVDRQTIEAQLDERAWG